MTGPVMNVSEDVLPHAQRNDPPVFCPQGCFQRLQTAACIPVKTKMIVFNTYI